MSLSTDFLKALNKPAEKETKPVPVKTDAGKMTGGASAGAPIGQEVKPQTTREKANVAAKNLEVYRASDEYKKNQQARNAQYQKDLLVHRMMTGTADTFGSKLNVDRKEEELKAEAQKWQQAADKEDGSLEEQKRAIRRQQVAALSDKERELLDRYAQDRRDSFVASLDQTRTSTVNFEDNPLVQKYGREQLDKMADAYTAMRNEQAYEEAQQKGIEEANKSGWSAAVGSAKSVGANLAGNLLSPLSRIADSAGRFDRPMDQYSAGDVLYGYSSGVRGQTAQNISGDQYDEAGNKVSDGGLGRQLLSYAYQGGMSAADSVARGLVGGSGAVGAGLAAMGSFNQTLSDAIGKGASNEQAIALATATAGIEYLTEKLPLDNLMDIVAGGGKGVIKNIVKQSLTEIGEEEASLILTLLAEAAILRDKSGYNQRIQELTAQGMSEQEARKQANMELLKEAGETAIVSGISGGMSAVGAQTANRMANRNQNAQQAEVQQEVDTETAVQEEPAQQVQQEIAREPQLSNEADYTGTMAAVAQDRQNEQAQREKAAYDAEQERRRNSALQAQQAKAETEAQKQKAVEDLKAAQRELTRLEKDLERAETRLRENGKGSVAYIRQLRSQVEQQRAEVERARNQSAYAGGEIAGTLEAATAEQEALFADLREQARQADADFRAGKITQAQLQAANDAYNRAGAELARLKRMTPEQYRAELGSMGIQAALGTAQNAAVSEPEAEQQAENQAPAGKPDRQLKGGKEQTGEQAQEVNPISAAWAKTMEQKAQPQARQETPLQAAAEAFTKAAQPKAQTTAQPEAQAQGEGIKGTGAAERGFTPKQALINQYGNIPEGENPVRPDQLPASTNGTDRVSRTARTALEARVTPDEFVPLIENNTVNGRFSYIPITNNETVQRATETIAYEGWQTARANWQEQVHRGVTSPEITATGALLYNHAVNAGDHEEAMEILADYQMAVRNSAQALQAARILKTLTPEDRLWMIRRSVEAMVHDMNLRRPVEINENLADAYVNAGTQEEADEILDQIAADVARQIPATGMEAFTALRYVNMLGNFRTQVRNIAGNTGSKIVYGIKDKIGAAVEAIASELTGGRIERTKSFITDTATREAAAADFEQVQQWIQNGGRYNDRGTESDDFRQRVEDRRRLLPQGLEQYRRLTNWAMEQGDIIFSRSAYARALAGYLNARGIRTGDLSTVDAETLDRAREYAVQQAQEQTFRDNNQVSDFVGGILRGRNTPAWARVLGEGIMPFRKTPANVLVRAEEFSPLGLINSTVNTIRAARGEITGAELVESWSKTLTGTALFAMGAFLADMGWLNGGPDEDEDKAAFDQLNGEQNYSLEFNWNGKTYTYTIDWLTPAAMPMFLGAQLQKVFREKGEDISWADWEKVLTAVGDPLISMSMLQGLSDTLGDLRYAENNLGQFLINAATSYLTQGLSNTLLGQIERSTESSRMTTYVDKDSATPQWLQRQLGKVSAKTPGWDYQQTEYIDARGETQKQDTGPLGWIYNLLSPGYVSEKTTDAVSEELYRLNDAGVDGNVFPQSPETKISYTDSAGNRHDNYNLSAQEADTLKRVTGQTAMEIVGELIESPSYKAMTDAQKAKAVQEVYSYAREQGRAAALEGYTVSDKWMRDTAKGTEAAVIARRAISSDIESAATAINEAWSKAYNAGTTQKASDEMEQAYQVIRSLGKSEREKVVEGLSGTAAKYVEAREKGISPEDFNTAGRAVKTAKGTGKNGAMREIDKREAIAKAHGLTSAEIDLLMEIYMPDYDPTEDQPDTTEVKYAYIRQEMGLSAAEYAETYRAYSEAEKKREQVAAIQALGYDYRTAVALYNVYAGNKKKVKYLEWYEKQQ